MVGKPVKRWIEFLMPSSRQRPSNIYIQMCLSFSSSQCFAIYHPKLVHVINLKITWARVHANGWTLALGSKGLQLFTLPYCLYKVFSFILRPREEKDVGCLGKSPTSQLILITLGRRRPCSRHTYYRGGVTVSVRFSWYWWDMNQLFEGTTLYHQIIQI